MGIQEKCFEAMRMMHVCPYCENVEMQPAYVKVSFKGKEYEFAGFRCPECGAEIVPDYEVNFVLKRIKKMTE